MQTRQPLSTPLWGMQESGPPRLHETESPALPSRVPPLRQPDQILRRQMLVSELFQHVQEIRSLEHGYALRFDRSGDIEALLGTMAEYIVLESLYSSQFTVTIDEAPRPNGFWLRVRYEESKSRQNLGVALSVP